MQLVAVAVYSLWQQHHVKSSPLESCLRPSGLARKSTRNARTSDARVRVLARGKLLLASDLEGTCGSLLGRRSAGRLRSAPTQLRHLSFLVELNGNPVIACSPKIPVGAESGHLARVQFRRRLLLAAAMPTSSAHTPYGVIFQRL